MESANCRIFATPALRACFCGPFCSHPTRHPTTRTGPYIKSLTEKHLLGSQNALRLSPCRSVAAVLCICSPLSSSSISWISDRWLRRQMLEQPRQFGRMRPDRFDLFVQVPPVRPVDIRVHSSCLPRRRPANRCQWRGKLMLEFRRYFGSRIIRYCRRSVYRKLWRISH